MNEREVQAFLSGLPKHVPQRTAKFRAGQIISDSMHGLSGVGVVESGRVDIYAVALDGRDVQLNSIDAGECFGICNLLVAEPLQTVLRCAEETGAIIAAEEHSVIGGLGGAVAECLSKAGAGVPTEMVGVQDTFTESGPYNQLLKKYALDGAAVADAIRRAVGRKK